MAVVEWELILGLWLLSEVAGSLAWVFALATFAGFAFVSGRLAWQGVASCNCLGPIRTNPWLACAIDAVAVIALLSIRPTLSAVIGQLPDANRASRMTGMTVVGLVLAFAFWVSGGYSQARWLIAGEALQADSHYLDFGTLAAGEIASRDVTITNVSNATVRVAGGTIDCRCHITDIVPSIAPGGRGTIRVSVKAPAGTAGRTSFPVEVWTDATRQPIVWLTVDFQVR